MKVRWYNVPLVREMIERTAKEEKVDEAVVIEVVTSFFRSVLRHIKLRDRFYYKIPSIGKLIYRGYITTLVQGRLKKGKMKNDFNRAVHTEKAIQNRIGSVLNPQQQNQQ